MLSRCTALILLAALAAGAAPAVEFAAMTPTYRVLRTAGGEPGGWSEAPIATFGPDRYRTEFRALWSGEGLWIRFDAVDPNPWNTFTRRDDPLWEEEVVEIFIDPDGDGLNYAEVEISPANVVTDLLMFRGDPGKRSDIDWDFAGLQTWVTPLRDGREGWTAIALLPWEGFATLPETATPVPPAPGDSWRFNIFRIKRPGGPESPQSDAVFAAWSPPPGPSFHVPEVFGTMIFD